MRTRLGLKAIGISALMMGVMAIGTAGVVHAEAGACWSYLINGVQKCLGEGGLVAKPLFELGNNTGTLSIENVNFEILCTGVELDEGGQLAANGSILLGRLRFTGCITLSRSPILSELGACTPNDPVGGLGVILTEKLTGLIKLHESEPIILITPDSAKTLVKIFLGEECSFGEETLVKGELVLGDCEGKGSFEEHKLTHLFEEFSKLRLLHVGTNKATIDGSANITLDAPHNTLLWAGKPA